MQETLAYSNTPARSSSGPSRTTKADNGEADLTLEYEKTVPSDRSTQTTLRSANSAKVDFSIQISLKSGPPRDPSTLDVESGVSREAGAPRTRRQQRPTANRSPSAVSRSSSGSGARERTGTLASPERRERSARPGRDDGGRGEGGGACAGRGHVRAHALRVCHHSPSEGGGHTTFLESLDLHRSSQLVGILSIHPQKRICPPLEGRWTPL